MTSNPEPALHAMPIAPPPDLPALLPSTSFVPATLYRVARPQLAWCRDATRGAAMLRDFAFCAPLPGDDSAGYLPETKSCLAERYGGRGVSGNGGGVRCGLTGGMTIKGIGRTELAGLDAPYWHSYGGASMREAIREAIWGEVYDAALPHGAVRVDAIIGTGAEVPLHYTDSLGKDTCARALIVREPFLRPAHYLRSTIFQPPPGFADKYVSDPLRTAAAVRQIDSGLRAAFPQAGQGDLLDLLGLAFRRYAAQLSAMRVKRLLHGSVSASNITLDGRMLDFGMSSAVSDHGRIIIARGWPDPWMQHEPLLRTIDELLLVLRKYRPQPPVDTAGHDLRTAFTGALDSTLRAELLKLSGVPRNALAGLSAQDVRSVSGSFIAVLEEGNREPFKLLCPCPDYKPAMPRKMGRYHLGACLSLCAAAGTMAQADALLRDGVPDAALRARLVAAFWTLRDAAVRTYGDSAALAAFLRFNAQRLNADLHSLYAIDLNPAIDHLLAEGGDVAAFIRTKAMYAAALVTDFDEQATLILADGARIDASPRTGVRAATGAGAELGASDLAAAFPFLHYATEAEHASRR